MFLHGTSGAAHLGCLMHSLPAFLRSLQKLDQILRPHPDRVVAVSLAVEVGEEEAVVGRY